MIALLVAELFGTLIFANPMTCGVTMWTQISGVKSQKLNISHNVFCIKLKLSTVVALIAKFCDMSTVTFPWQHNGLQVLSIQRGKSEFSSFKKCYALVVHSVGVSNYGHYTAQAQESLLNSGATNKAVFI